MSEKSKEPGDEDPAKPEKPSRSKLDPGRVEIEALRAELNLPPEGSKQPDDQPDD